MSFFEQNELLNKNLQKGMERWLEQDLKQRGRTCEEIELMTLNRPTENDRSLFMCMVDSYFNKTFDELLERTVKELIQEWSQEGGKKEFAIGIILEILKDRSELDDGQSLKALLSNIDDWLTIKKLVGLATLMPGHFFHVYTLIIERVLKGDSNTKKDIIVDIKLLLNMQFGKDVVDELTPIIESIDDLQELKQTFIEAARTPNLASFRTVLPDSQNTIEPEGPQHQKLH